MTRKHYIALAKALALIEDAYIRGVCAKAVADACAADNPRFDRDKFYKACNVLVA